MAAVFGSPGMDEETGCNCTGTFEFINGQSVGECTVDGNVMIVDSSDLYI